MSFIEFLSTYDLETQTFKDDIKIYKDPLNLTTHFQQNESIVMKIFKSFIKF